MNINHNKIHKKIILHDIKCTELIKHYMKQEIREDITIDIFSPPFNQFNDEDYQILKYAQYYLDKITIYPKYTKDIKQLLVYQGLSLDTNQYFWISNSEQIKLLGGVGASYHIISTIEEIINYLITLNIAQGQIEKDTIYIQLKNSLLVEESITSLYLLLLSNQVLLKNPNANYLFFGEGVASLKIVNRMFLSYYIDNTVFFDLENNQYPTDLEIDLFQLDLLLYNLQENQIKFWHYNDRIQPKVLFSILNDTLVTREFLISLLVCKNFSKSGYSLPENIIPYLNLSGTSLSESFKKESSRELISNLYTIGFQDINEDDFLLKNVEKESFSIQSVSLKFLKKEISEYYISSSIAVVLSAISGHFLIENIDYLNTFWPSDKEIEELEQQFYTHPDEEYINILKELSYGSKKWHTMSKDMLPYGMTFLSSNE